MTTNTDHDAERIDREKWKAVYDAMVYAIAGPQQRWFDLSHQMASDDNDVWIHAMQRAVEEAERQGLIAADAQYQQQHAPDLDALLIALTDDTLPGLTVGIARNDGEWDIQQMYTGLEEQYPTDVHGADADLVTAIRAAVAAAKGQGDE